MKKYRRGFFIILSFVVAFILMIIPVSQDFQWVRPEWVTLVLIYWIFTLPQSVGIVTAWCVGLILDSLTGGIVGQYALSMVIVAVLARSVRYRIYLIPRWQQWLVIFVLVATGEGVVYLTQMFMGSPPKTFLYWLPTLLSVIGWSWFFRFMKFYKQKAFA